MIALDSSLPFALASPHRLQQCLTALVDNALLYTDGPVILTASRGPAGELVLHVIDRGPGVLPSEREAIFGRFVRGSGIGLPVVRLLIEAMGGRVQVADAPVGGADFQLLLPGVRAGAGEATRENTEVGGGSTDVL
jgi:two-component system, OmpR family, sensor kinase